MFGNGTESQAIEIKPIKCPVVQSGLKTRGENMKDSLAMLLKTNGEKMSFYGSLAMLMKINQLKSFSRDIDETKGERNTWKL